MYGDMFAAGYFENVLDLFFKELYVSRCDIYSFELSLISTKLFFQFIVFLRDFTV